MQVKILIFLIFSLLLSIGSTLILGYFLYLKSTELDDANVVLAARRDEIQDFSSKLGLAESNLRKQKDLADKYGKELESLDDKFTKLTRKYKLDIRSRDETIAGLRGKIKGGKTTVGIGSEGEFTTIVEVPKDICDGKALSYTWEDDKARFKLKDPDIFKSGNEEFEYRQHFQIKGYVFADKTGNIQLKKIELQEVYPEKNEDGDIDYTIIEDSNINLVSSKFEYTNKIEKSKKLLDAIALRPVGLLDSSGFPGIGLEVINLGNYLDYVNLGLYGKVAFDTSNVLNNSLSNSRIGLGINYHLVPPFLNTNFALGASINAPFNDLSQHVFSIDLILYLTEDFKLFK